jgi:uncharacterized FlaG/YvyC family protein
MFKFLDNLFGNPSKKKVPVMDDDRKPLPPPDFFNKMKDQRHTITKETLDTFYQQGTAEADKFIKTGQREAAEHILYHLNNIRREYTALEAGYDKYVFRDDLEFYIKEVSQKVVKIIDIENFPRSIPDEQALEVMKAKAYFDQLYVVFTDYTGEVERKIAKKDRAHDPIVFGVFVDKKKNIWNHRFYYITDWVDEYCDLTLDKFLTEMLESGYGDRSIQTIEAAPTMEELQARLKELQEDDQ